jgi:hypothetical protein
VSDTARTASESWDHGLSFPRGARGNLALGRTADRRVIGVALELVLLAIGATENCVA